MKATQMTIRKYTINHVMSKNIDSGIFTAILGYFKKYSPSWVEHIESVNPIDGADIYHYHRPHLERKLLDNAVCTVHHDLDDPDVWHSRQRFIPRYVESAAVICLNSKQKSILLDDEGLPAESINVVAHGYNNEVLALAKKNRLPGDKFVIGIASRRYGRRVKGEAYLLELVKRLNPAGVKFVLVGEDRSIDAISLRKLGFEVDVFERLPYRVFQGFYSKIDALLMCSSHEGGPANVPEALATGTPIFSSRVGMSLDFIKHKENGFFLSLDPDLDAADINEILDDRSAFSGIEANCRALAFSIPTWQDSVAGNLSVYSKIIGADICFPSFVDVPEDEFAVFSGVGV